MTALIGRTPPLGGAGVLLISLGGGPSTFLSSSFVCSFDRFLTACPCAVSPWAGSESGRHTRLRLSAATARALLKRGPSDLSFVISRPPSSSRTRPNCRCWLCRQTDRQTHSQRGEELRQDFEHHSSVSSRGAFPRIRRCKDVSWSVRRVGQGRQPQKTLVNHVRIHAGWRNQPLMDQTDAVGLRAL
ncbi:uncharacterized protein LY79DRAFT_35477 [Colletotrichum navitas]|uniref:Uncharacterized protein n=1 Tax=Colletotrichum navitas TaxID=681940 RepID=A0AAD8Q6Q6_9PEZI|nr:uncharacterized protein LY79DRAFT_35477 [Colletotrichum navitas]KAK1596911.1 hypothetical protein LY79DRAFT_35477 [Colletotrichum navitas]